MERRRTGALRRNQVSIPGARYFVTANLKDRKPALANDISFKNALALIDMCSQKSIASSLGLLLMPDHAHWLFCLGEHTSLVQVMRMFKFHIGDGMRQSGIYWQGNFFEHRLRDSEDPESYGRYIFLNPYRAGLVPRNSVWPYWDGSRKNQFRFEEALEDGKYPPAAWLDQPEVHPVDIWRQKNP